MQSIDSLLKSNNEIEICEVYSQESKQALEKQLHKQRISFSIRFIKPKLFSKQKNTVCYSINDGAREAVVEIIKGLSKESQENIKIIDKKSSKNFL